MLFTITGKHIEITESLKEHAKNKTSKLPRYYSSIQKVEVIIEGDGGGGHKKVEIIARAKRRKVFVVKETGEDVYSCIDLAVHKLEMQLHKIKSKERDSKYPAGRIEKE